METVHTPFARPMYIMTKAAGSMCNLACKYCYYLEKNNLYKEQQPDRRFIMTDDTLERFIRMYIQSQTTPQVLFCWHGGESLMRPLSFYKRVVELQKNMPPAASSTTPSRPTAHCSTTSGAAFSVITTGWWAYRSTALRSFTTSTGATKWARRRFAR